jgi:hypothetical protein
MGAATAGIALRVSGALTISTTIRWRHHRWGIFYIFLLLSVFSKKSFLTYWCLCLYCYDHKKISEEIPERIESSCLTFLFEMNLM